jgi:rhamnogalacturonan endolyase
MKPSPLLAQLSALPVLFGLFCTAVYGSTPVDSSDRRQDSSSALVLNDFEDESDRSRITPSGDITAISIETDPNLRKSGRGGLRVELEDAADGVAGGRPLLKIKLAGPVALAEYRALSFWIHAPEKLTKFFFGRFDINVLLDGKTSWQIPAINAGWQEVVWDFSELEIPGSVREISIRLGPLLEGYERGTIHIDALKLISKDSLSAGSTPAEVIASDPSWSRRWRAVEAINQSMDLASLEAVIKAAGDDSKAVRSLSVAVMTRYAERYGDKIKPQLDAALRSSNWGVRLAIAELIFKSRGALGQWAPDKLNALLHDDIYYVRSSAYKSLQASGTKTEDIVSRLATDLADQDQEKIKRSLRMLSEIGGKNARSAADAILSVLRNRDHSLPTRCWALSAMWQIDETLLLPNDWILALGLKPGEVHRHLLNRAMDRLEIAGPKALPALIAALQSHDDDVPGRAAVILGNIGPAAHAAISALQELLANPNSPVAYEADQALAKILPGRPAQLANVPKNPVDQDVVVTRTGGETAIGNGILELVFQNGDDSPGPKIVRRVGGPNLADADWLPRILAFRYSNSPNMIERQWIQRLFGVPFHRKIETKLHAQDADSADFSIRFTGDEKNIFTWEYHFVLRRGESGFYTYVVVENVSGKALENSDDLGSQNGLGRYTFLVGLTKGLFDYVYMHDKLKGPASLADEKNRLGGEGYPDIYQSSYRMPSGELNAKHEWGNYELISNLNGYVGRAGGFWMMFPNLDFFGDSMPRHMSTSATGDLFVPHFEGKYYSGVSVGITKDWKKIYGPLYFYINDGPTPDAMWTDAKRQANAQSRAWPYAWLKLDAYQDRGTVGGKVRIADGQSAAGAYVVLSNPKAPTDPDQFGVWMRNKGSYNYWTPVAPDGSYQIEHVHAGTYNVYAFKPGVYGEVDGGKIEIAKDRQTNAGVLTLKPISKGTLLWQIGEADGGAMEFKNGRNYHQWDNYLRYRKDFPNDVYFRVGESDWSQDWNYIQPAAVQDEWKATTWTIDFDLNERAASSYLLTIMCSGRNANAKVLVNGKPVGDLSVSIGVHHARTVPYGEQVRKEFTIPVEYLQGGKNLIHLTFDTAKAARVGAHEAPEATHNRNWTSWISYDFIRFEALNP